MNEYHDPLSRGPKGHPPISSQPPPPHPRISGDDTSFRPTSECSPMFPDASFDVVSTNKSTNNYRPLTSPHMQPPPLPPNTPSTYSRTSLPLPVPTSVPRHDRWDDSAIPPSPMQIIMERQSASQSLQPREGREPHQDHGYPKVTNSQNAPYRGGEREDREPPSPTQRYSERSHDGHERRASRGYREQQYNNSYHSNDYHHNGSVNHHRNDYPSGNNSGHTHHRCNCENCRRKNDSRYYDVRGRCTHSHDVHHTSNQDSYGHFPHHDERDRHHHDERDRHGPSSGYESRHRPNHERHPNDSYYGHLSDYERHERREPPPSNYIPPDLRDYAPDPAHGNYSHGSHAPMSRMSHEQYRSGYNHEPRRSNYDSDRFDRPHHDQHRSHERVDHNHHYPVYNNERRTPPPNNVPMSPLSLPTFEDHPASHNRQAWSPKSDNATLHAETFQVPHYVTSFENNGKREHHDGGYHERREMQYEDRGNDNIRYSDERRRDQPNHYDDRNHHYGNERRESDINRYPDERQPHRRERNKVPTQVSYPSQESGPEHRHSNSSPDRRDDYSGSTIPTYSTGPQGRNSSPQDHRHHHVRQDSRPNLRVDIPVSPIVPPNNQPSHHGQERYQHQPHTSRSSGYRSASSSHSNPPVTTRSDPISQPSRPSRVAVAEREREKSEARHQILKEIHQATNMRNEALDENDRRFWERQIAILNNSFKNL